MRAFVPSDSTTVQYNRNRCNPRIIRGATQRGASDVWLTRSKLTHMASHNAAPAAAASQPASIAERQAVIFLGDSHTRGFYGASWLRLLKPQFPHLHFVNAGNDGEPSESIAARLPGLLAAHPDPAAVFIFAGSNDCIAQQTQDLQDWYKRTFRLSQYCSEQYALGNVERMLQLVQKQAPKAKVVVVNLPIMVEDPKHAANIRAHKYSSALSALVSSKYPAVSMVDFQAVCRQHMTQHSSKWQQTVQEMQQHGQDASTLSASADWSSAQAAADPAWSMTKYSLAGNMLWAKYLQSMLLRHSWDAISRKQGLVLLTDQIHINDTAANILAALVQPLLQEL